jgi:acyl carrier protein
MIPAAFVMMEALPLLQNGKVDRDALPPPCLARPALDNPPVGPRTPVEEVLVATWAEVLGLDQVGIHDHFFELGGDSFKAAQVIGRVIRDLNVELPLRFFFEAPTVAEMAVVITQSQAKASDPEMLERILNELEGQVPPAEPPISR